MKNKVLTSKKYIQFFISMSVLAKKVLMKQTLFFNPLNHQYYDHLLFSLRKRSSGLHCLSGQIQRTQEHLGAEPLLHQEEGEH
jgi:hypothetical protein